MFINVPIENQGNNTETFNVTIYANTIVIATETNITLTNGNSTTITFTWDTIGFTKGNYTITAAATPVPGERDTADNTCTDVWVLVTAPRDINGDGECNILDLKLVKLDYSNLLEEPNADIDNNGVINILDLKLMKLLYSGFIV